MIVTGSRIARPEFETLQPTQVVGAAQIENRGYTNVGQVLSEIPAFGPPVCGRPFGYKGVLERFLRAGSGASVCPAC